ncbi:MAG: hypothetical protein H7222_03040 [Methylotenera sp.]|nr:hypothetical protein [Oligoflexia bacterium]
MKVSRPLKQVLRYSFSGLYLAGSLYWLMKTWFRTPGEFGEPQPGITEKVAGPVHLLLAFTFLFVLGMVWSQHARFAVQIKKHRVTGWVFFGIIAGLAMTGVILAYVAQPDLIAVLTKIHPILGASLLPVLLYHWHSSRPGLTFRKMGMKMGGKMGKIRL